MVSSAHGSHRNRQTGQIGICAIFYWYDKFYICLPTHIFQNWDREFSCGLFSFNLWKDKRNRFSLYRCHMFIQLWYSITALVYVNMSVVSSNNLALLSIIHLQSNISFDGVWYLMDSGNRTFWELPWNHNLGNILIHMALPSCWTALSCFYFLCWAKLTGNMWYFTWRSCTL